MINHGGYWGSEESWLMLLDSDTIYVAVDDDYISFASTMEDFKWRSNNVGWCHIERGTDIAYIGRFYEEVYSVLVIRESIKNLVGHLNPSASEIHQLGESEVTLIHDIIKSEML